MVKGVKIIDDETYDEIISILNSERNYNYNTCDAINRNNGEFELIKDVTLHRISCNTGKMNMVLSLLDMG